MGAAARAADAGRDFSRTDGSLSMHLPRLALPILAAVLLAGLAGAAPVATQAAADPSGAELMRLTNLDRVALGLRPLATDSVRVSIARDRAFRCPGRTALVASGRSQDMATRNYFAHEILGCTNRTGQPVSSMDILVDVFGYNTYRAENIGWNTYGDGAVTYVPGCDVNGANCAGTPIASTGRAAGVEGDFMRSPGHRTNILYGYDRFGCASAQAADGRTYFTCLFSKGGPNPVSAPPSPTPPTPGPTSTPTPPAPTPTPPAPAPDTTAPRFVLLSGVARSLAAGKSLTETATVSDDRSLALMTLTLDGVTLGRWPLSGTTATRSVAVAASKLPRGEHVFRWTLLDAAGNSR